MPKTSARHEKTVTPKTPMPKGYGLLEKGNAYRTSLCRRKTLEANKILYVVKDKSNIIGIRAPKWILSQVFAEDRETRDKRKQTLVGRDATAKHAFEATILAQFPKIPRDEATAVVNRAMKKRSGRVGRTGKLSLEAKARLAVVAHVRHCHTGYDDLVKTKERDQARSMVQNSLRETLVKWGDSGKPKKLGKAKRQPRTRSTPRTSKTNAPRATEPNSNSNDDDVILISDDDDSMASFIDDVEEDEDEDEDSWSGIDSDDQDAEVITIESDSDT